PVLGPELTVDVESESQLTEEDPSSTENEDLFNKSMLISSKLRDNPTEISAGDSETLLSTASRLGGIIARNQHRLLSLQLNLNAQIREMQNLQEYSTLLDNQQNFFKAFTSPVRQFPMEVLAEIFSYHANEEILPPFEPMLLCFTQVCRTRRSASLGCTNLWTCLSINTQIADDWGLVLQRLPGVWFANAKDLPLSFSFLHRFVRLEIRPAELQGLTTFFQLPDNNLPMIREFVFLPRPSGEIPIFGIESLQLFRTTPHLRYFSFLHLAINLCNPASFCVPWNQLIILKTENTLNPYYWQDILHRCPRLEYGSFSIIRFMLQPPPQRQQLFTFKYLNTLEIIFSHTESDIGYLRNVRFPALQNTLITKSGKLVPVDSFIKTFPAGSSRHLRLGGLRMEIPPS
ncbi:hypothetical protein H0H81_003391, partial [Sphagnurus paluster]